MNKTSYFAYGSNMERKRMLSRCPNVEYAGTAQLPNYRFALDEAGYATVIPAQGENVEGCLWWIDNADEHRLDRYEGVSTDCYTKATVRVRPAGYFSKFDAMAYISLRKINTGARVRGYMEDIVSAAGELGLTGTYTENLKKLV